MKIQTAVIATIATLFLLHVGPVAAHHGLEGYDTSKLIELKGKVVGMELMDPHSVLFVDVENEDGSVTSWVIEGGSAHGIVRAGLTPDSLNSGPTATILGYQSIDRNCTPKCKANGRDFTFEQ